MKPSPDIAVFDTSDAANPKYSHNITGKFSHVTDEFISMADGGFLITQMGGLDGEEEGPGRGGEGRGEANGSPGGRGGGQTDTAKPALEDEAGYVYVRCEGGFVSYRVGLPCSNKIQSRLWARGALKA
jgi:hypothetical protein